MCMCINTCTYIYIHINIYLAGRVWQPAMMPSTGRREARRSSLSYDAAVTLDQSGRCTGRQAGRQRHTAVGMTLHFCCGRNWPSDEIQRGQGDISFSCALTSFVVVFLQSWGFAFGVFGAVSVAWSLKGTEGLFFSLSDPFSGWDPAWTSDFWFCQIFGLKWEKGSAGRQWWVEQHFDQNVITVVWLFAHVARRLSIKSDQNTPTMIEKKQISWHF